MSFIVLPVTMVVMETKKAWDYPTSRPSLPSGLRIASM